MCQFWKCWNFKFSKPHVTPTSIEDETDPAAIANKFRDFYSGVYVNSYDNQESLNEFTACYNSHYASDSRLNDATVINSNYKFDTDCIELSIKSLKLNKAAGLDDVLAEHIVHSRPATVVHLKLLFT